MINDSRQLLWQEPETEMVIKAQNSIFCNVENLHWRYSFCNQYQTLETCYATCRISGIVKKKLLIFLPKKTQIIFCLWRCCVRHAEQSVIWSLARIKTRQCQQNSNGYWVVKQLLPIFHFVYKTGKLTKRVPKHKIWKLQSKSNFSNFYSFVILI